MHTLSKSLPIIALVGLTQFITPQQAQGQRGMGLVPSPREEIERLPHLRLQNTSTSQRPKHLDLRDTGYLPPVGDQGNQGSCVGWATAYYLYTYAKGRRERRTPDQLRSPQFQYSPAFIYNRPERHWSTPEEKSRVDRGMAISVAVATLRDKGCATLSEMPYNQSDASNMPDSVLLAKARQRHASSVLPLQDRDVESIKGFLAESRCPVVIAITVFADFYRLSGVSEDYIYENPRPGTPTSGTHAITLVGYDDSKHAFLMVNSWGTGFGNKGFLWVSEDFIRENSFEPWGVVPGGNLAMGSVFAPTRVPGLPHLFLIPPKSP